MLGCMQEYVDVYVLVYYACLVACGSDADSSVRSEPITGDPDPTQNCARYEPGTLAFRRPTHEMIQRFVLVHAVKTRRRFGSKIVSFHVSVYSYVFLYYCC